MLIRAIEKPFDGHPQHVGNLRQSEPAATGGSAFEISDR